MCRYESFFLASFLNFILKNKPFKFCKNKRHSFKTPDAVVALMKATSCVPRVQAHRYSGQQELAPKKTAEINLSRLVCGGMNGLS
jgi:hypothetical protein